MLYFGPTGITQGPLHPSLKAYIDCFLTPPFPKMFPRGGGIWDQDPLLIRDFRTIRRFEMEWKNAQGEIDDARSKLGIGSAPSAPSGVAGLGDVLNEYIESLEDQNYE